MSKYFLIGIIKNNEIFFENLPPEIVRAPKDWLIALVNHQIVLPRGWRNKPIIVESKQLEETFVFENQKIPALYVIFPRSSNQIKELLYRKFSQDSLASGLLLKLGEEPNSKSKFTGWITVKIIQKKQ